MSEDRTSRFEQAFRRWAEREPTTPPPAAAARIVTQLPERRLGRRLGGRRLGLAAAAAVVLVFVVWIAVQTLPSRPISSEGEVALPPLDEEVLLLWLDDQTPLYLTVAPPAATGGSS